MDRRNSNVKAQRQKRAFWVPEMERRKGRGGVIRDSVRELGRGRVWRAQQVIFRSLFILSSVKNH